MADTVTLRIRVSPEDLQKIESQIAGATKQGKKPLDIPVAVPKGAAQQSPFDDLKKKALSSVTAIGAATGAMMLFGLAFDGAMSNQDQMLDLSANTGVTGAALDDLGNRAEKLSDKFGTTLKGNIESMKGVLSRLGPDIATDSAALGMMTEDINILAKASGLDATASMDALTTSVLQFGTDLSDPTRAAGTMTEMMNVMAAGAQQGAAEIPQVSEAIKQAGVAAYGANVSFVETNAALQVLAAGGKVGSEAGVALRNVLGLLQKPSTEAIKALKAIGLSSTELGQSLTTNGIEPTLQLLGDAMNKLKTPAEKNTMLMTLFGVESASAAQIMIRASRSVDGGASAFASLSEKLTGTNTAVEQAKLKSASLSETWARTREGMANMAAGLATQLMPMLSGAVAGFQAMVPALTVIGQMIVPGIVAWGAYTLAVNASTIATSLASNAFLKMGVAMLTNPFFITAAAIAASVVYLKSLKNELEISAQKTLDNTNAEIELNSAKKATNVEDQKRIESTQKLMDKYEKLGSKTTRTKAEEEQLTKAMVGINQEYPGLISSGDSFAANMERIRSKGEQLKGELNKLREEMAGLSKQEGLLKMEQLADQADVAAEGIMKAFKKFDSNFFDDLGIGNAEENFNKQFGSFVQAVKYAVTEKEFRDAHLAFQKAISSFGDASTRNEMNKAAVEFIAAQKKYVTGTEKGALLGTEKPLAEKPATVVDPDAANKGKEAREKAMKDALDRLKIDEDINTKAMQLAKVSDSELLALKGSYLKQQLEIQKKYGAAALDIEKTEGDIQINQMEQQYGQAKDLVEGSLDFLEARLSELQQQIKGTDPNSTAFAVLIRQAIELEGKIADVNKAAEFLKTPDAIGPQSEGRAKADTWSMGPRSTDLTAEETDTLEKTKKRLTEQEEQFKALGEAIGSAFSNAFGDAIENGRVGEALTKMFRQILGLTLEYILREAMLAQVAATLKSLATQGLFGILQAGLITSTIAGLSSFAKKAVVGFEYGGVVVGEKGPEIIAPATEFSQFAGSIVANAIAYMQAAMQRMMEATTYSRTDRSELTVKIIPGESQIGFDTIKTALTAQISRDNRAVLGGM